MSLGRKKDAKLGDHTDISGERKRVTVLVGSDGDAVKYRTKSGHVCIFMCVSCHMYMYVCLCLAGAQTPTVLRSEELL